MPLLRTYEDRPEPTCEAFREEYENELLECREECPEQMNAEGVEVEVRGMPTETSGGTDGWRTAEAHLLPSVSFKARHQVFEAAAEGGGRPIPFQYCTIPMLPKTK